MAYKKYRRVDESGNVCTPTTLTSLVVDEVTGTSISDVSGLLKVLDITDGSIDFNTICSEGTYKITGERTNASDGLPILNSNPGHTVDGILKVLDSSISGSSQPTDKVVTQILTMSNRTGGDGHIWIRTGQGVDKSSLTWSTWEKLQGLYEKNEVSNVSDINGYTTNGMYSGIIKSGGTISGKTIHAGTTFLIVTINGYAVAASGLPPQATQMVYLLPAGYDFSTGMPNLVKAELYVRTASYNSSSKTYVWGDFVSLGAVTEEEKVVILDRILELESLSSNNQTRISELESTSTNIQNRISELEEVSSSNQTRISNVEALSSNNQMRISELNDNVTVANSKIAGLIDDVSEIREVADAAQAKNTEQDERIGRIENNVAYLGIAGRYWDENNATSTAAGYYGSLQALRYLPERLGLGRYLVTDYRQRKKLDPTDSTKYLDGTSAALDGSEGQCMWCWNGFYANIWHEGSRLIKAVTFDKPVGGETSIWIPAGGISWLGAGVMDRTNQKLCSLISDAEQYRGGSGAALNPASYAKAPGADSPQITMLGMPATNISTTNFGNYARKRGEGWEANWFVARFVVEFLFEVIMGTENSQAAFNAEKDANGLYQGGFGTGVTDMPDWGGYNGSYPVIPTSVGLEAGDGVCLVPYSLPQTDGAEGEAYKTFNVPVFFGLVGAGFGHLWQWTRGLIMDAGDKSLVYVTPSMYADYDPNTVADKILVAECPQKEGYIKRKSYQGLCCMPTEVGGSATTRFADYFYTNAATSKGLRVRAAGGYAPYGAHAGASCTSADSTASAAYAHYSAPLCYFEEDPVIPETQRIG